MHFVFFTVQILIFATLAAVLSASVNKSSVKGINITEIIEIIERDKNVQNLMDNLKRQAIIGVAIGTEKAVKSMEKNLFKLIQDLVMSFHNLNMNRLMKKYQKIQETMDRDKKSISLLTNAMDLATNSKTIREYRQALNMIANNETSVPDRHRVFPKDKKQLMRQMHSNVNDHLISIRENVGASVQKIFSSMQHKKKSEIGSAPVTVTSAENNNDILEHETHDLPQFYVRMPVWPIYQFDVESFYRFRRQNDNAVDNDVNKDGSEEEFVDNPLGPDGGGIAGLIASLSGGESGSDVGALVGALSGVISNLFGVNFQFK
jgi:hypothetical protein